MASYVMLFCYPHQGIEHVKQSPDRVDALKKVFNKHGPKIRDFYALLGQYDTLFIVARPTTRRSPNFPCTSLSRATRGSRRTARSPRQNFANCCRRSTNRGCEPRSACRVDICIGLRAIPRVGELRHRYQRLAAYGTHYCLPSMGGRYRTVSESDILAGSRDSAY